MSVANIAKLEEKFHSRACNYSKWLRNFRSKRTTFLQLKADFAAVQKFPSTWSDLLAMAVTPSFQLRIAHRLKHWIVDFLSFETTYRIHKLNSRKCSKSGWHDCHLECFMLDFSLLSLLAFWICFWQRTSKLRFFMFLSSSLLCHGFQRTLLHLGLLWW